MQWNLTRGAWSAREMKNHIKVLEYLALKLALQTFSTNLKHKSIHLQADIMLALTYLLKMCVCVCVCVCVCGGSQNLKLVHSAKEI